MPVSSFVVDLGRGVALEGRLLVAPRGAPSGYALLAHCFACGGDSATADALAEPLLAAGVGVLTLDFTGTGRIDASASGSRAAADVGTVALEVDELVAAAEALAARRGAVRLLVGHSLAGTALLRAALRLPEAGAVVTLNAPASPNRMRLLLDPEPAASAAGAQNGDAPARSDTARVVEAGRGLVLSAAALEELGRDSVLAAAAALRRPLLVLHAPTDNVVGVDHAAALLDAAKHPKSFLALPRTDHLLRGAEAAPYAGALIAAWAAPLLRASGTPDPEPAPKGAWVRTGRGLRSDAVVRGFPLTLDEPVAAGGTGLGPAPYDLLATALATCTTMTLRLYADRKGWPLEAASAHVTHRKVAPEGAPPGAGAAAERVDAFAVEVELEGPLDEAQRARLLEIANRCPVHRTLAAQARVTVRLAEPVEPAA